MNRSRSHALAAAVLLATVFGAPDFAAAVDEPNIPPPVVQSAPATAQPATGGHRAKKKAHKRHKAAAAQRTSSADDLVNGYHAAHALIYDHGDFEGGIAALRALGHDENADVATLIGYASRKLGRYDDAQYWYEHALAADPNHAVTWSYYGMWQAEQGNLLKAKDDLEKVRLICGNTECRAYTMLKEVIDGSKTY
jgi:tetratricopeptide (TPR) repeat protein